MLRTGLLTLLILHCGTPLLAQCVSSQRVSAASFGTGGGNAVSQEPAISADGRFVVFSTEATNLLTPDANARVSDILLYDAESSGPVLISKRNSDGGSTNADSFQPQISGDGRYIAFVSLASDIVAGDTNGSVGDAFVFDRETDQARLISKDATGLQNPSQDCQYAAVGDSGRFVAFSSAGAFTTDDSNSVDDVFFADSGNTTRGSAGNGQPGITADGPSRQFSMSTAGAADGLYVVFESEASNLVNGDDNNSGDVFLRDTLNFTTIRISEVDGKGGSGVSTAPAISADGDYVAFQSEAFNLVQKDTNSVGDVFVFNRQNGAIALASAASDQTQGNNTSSVPSISGDGRYVVFASKATNLVSDDRNGVDDIFLRDLASGTIRRVSIPGCSGEADDLSFAPKISRDGRFVVYVSLANNLAGASGGTFQVIRTDTQPAAATPTPTETPFPTSTPEPHRTLTLPPGASPKVVRAAVRTQLNSTVASDLPDVSQEISVVTVSIPLYGVSFEDSQRAGARRPAYKPKYRLQLKGGSRTRRRLSSKNRIVFARLKKGSYRARYRVEVHRGKNPVAKTNYSGSRKFTVN